MENFIYDYFIQPIWDRTGYNIVNTLAYAMIAIAAIFLLHRGLKGRVRIDDGFIWGVLSFVLFGSTVRVVTDSIDNGRFLPITPLHEFVLQSHLWDYSYFTVTPGIYIVTAALMLLSLALLHRVKRTELLGLVGIILWLPHFLLLVPLMEYAAFAIPIFALALIPAYLAWLYFRQMPHALIVAGQALDGAATFFIIDIFSSVSGIRYFEQHVVGSAIGAIFGTYFAFYLLKVGIGFAAAYMIRKEGMDAEDASFIALVLMIMGFAPGIRDILRMVVGA